jgi:hypothetical protein
VSFRPSAPRTCVRPSSPVHLYIKRHVSRSTSKPSRNNGGRPSRKQRGPPGTRISQICFVARGGGGGGMVFLVEPRCMVRVTCLHECLLTTFTVERGADSHVYNVGSSSMYRLLEYKTMGFAVSPLNRPSSTRFSNMRRLVRSSCTQAISVHIQRLGRGFL